MILYHSKHLLIKQIHNIGLLLRNEQPKLHFSILNFDAKIKHEPKTNLTQVYNIMLHKQNKIIVELKIT